MIKATGPIDTLWEFIGNAILLDWNGRKYPKPGQLTMHMPESARAALGNITSDGIAKMRIEPWECEGVKEVARKQHSKMLTDFDKKILRR